MKAPYLDSINTDKSRGFTVLELIVAVSVTAVLSGMLLLISNQVLETKSKSSAELERNQLAHFILDQIQEDLQCSLFRNDGNIWMAISLLSDKRNSGAWMEATKSELGKPSLDSLRIIESDWPTGDLLDSEIDPLGQGPFGKVPLWCSRYMVAVFLPNTRTRPNLKKSRNCSGNRLSNCSLWNNRFHYIKAEVSIISFRCFCEKYF